MQVLECLQMNSDRLGIECRHVIFSVKRSELLDSSTDYMLITTCRDMIYQYCHDVEKAKVLECLKVHKDEALFNPQCHVTVVNRMIEQNMDYRFNPRLQEACAKNIADYCTKIVANAKENEELNGKVVNCLKAKFREGQLTRQCEQRMTEVLHEQALNYKLNPLLQSVCQSEIQVLCRPTGDESEDNGRVEECLKMSFLAHKIVGKECKYEVATLIQEAKADIHVDPILQTACTVDLLKYCSNVPSGNGRREFHFRRQIFCRICIAFVLLELRCLQTILTDQSKALDNDCREKLEKRMEMYANAAAVSATANMYVRLNRQLDPFRADLSTGARGPRPTVLANGDIALEKVLLTRADDLHRDHLHYGFILWTRQSTHHRLKKQVASR